MSSLFGPARLMEDNGVFVTQWDGNVRNVPPRNLPVPTLPKSVDLKAWKTATGDSGWAGWVAEQLMKDKAPVSVIFSAGTDTLTLVREALDLLPPTQRWAVTYCTYFTKLLAGTECQLRFVLDDTPEATALRNDARARVVDLTKGRAVAEGGALVTQARTGRVQLGNSDMPEPPIQNRSQPQIQAESIRPAVPALGRNVESMSSGSLPEIPTLNPTAPAIPFGSRNGPPDLFDKPIRKNGRRTWVLYAAGSLLMMAVASGVTYFVVTKMNNGDLETVETPIVASNNARIASGDHRFEISKSQNNAAVVDQHNTETGNSTLPKTNGVQSDPTQGGQSTNPTGETEPDSRPVNAKGTKPETTPGGDGATTKESEQKIEPVPAKGEPKKVADPFSLARVMEKHLDERNALLLELPDPMKADSVEIPLIIQGDPVVQIEILKSFFEDLKTPDSLNELMVKYKPNDDGKFWDVILFQGEKQQDVLARLELAESNNDPKWTHTLRFTWNTPAKNAGNDAGIALVKWSPITIKIGDDSESLLLSRPDQMAGPSASRWLTEAGGRYVTEVGPTNPFGSLAAKEFKSLRCRIQVKGKNGHVCSIVVPADNKEADFLLMPPAMELLEEKFDGSTKYLVKIEPQLKTMDKMLFELNMKCRISCRAFGMLGDDTLQAEIKKPLNPKTYTDFIGIDTRVAVWTKRLSAARLLNDPTQWSEFEVSANPDLRKTIVKQTELLKDLAARFEGLKEKLTERKRFRDGIPKDQQESDLKREADKDVKTLESAVGEVDALKETIAALHEEIEDARVSEVKVKIKELNDYLINSEVKIELYVPISTPSKSKTLEVHFLTSTWN